VPQFSRKTIIAAVATMENWTHTQINRFGLEYGLEGTMALAGTSKLDRANTFIKFLLQSPTWPVAEGGMLADVAVRDLIHRAAAVAPEMEKFETSFPDLARALQRDGFGIADGKLRLGLPESLDLPATDDEVHRLLEDFAFAVPEGHLDQAITNHSEGLWAAANGQLRTYMESLFDEIAATLAGPGVALPAPGHPRRTWLAALTPPFLDPALNEWDGQGKGFLEGFYRRLHPTGSHPGLSDEDDCTFRLHLVLLVSRLVLRRLRSRVPKKI
jgi:hypothetical protein